MFSTVASASFSRRTLLKASTASAVMGSVGAPHIARAQAAEFSYKFANNLTNSGTDSRMRWLMPSSMRPIRATAFVETECFLFERIEGASMRLHLASAAFGLAFATGATAADEPYKVRPLAEVQVYNWTGFYIGSNIGANFQQRVAHKLFSPCGEYYGSKRGCRLQRRSADGHRLPRRQLRAWRRRTSSRYRFITSWTSRRQPLSPACPALLPSREARWYAL